MDIRERKVKRNQTYPERYVKMLEQQQSQLVSGLQEMYYRLQKASAWEGPSLSESSRHPVANDILTALNLLELKQDDSGEVRKFEENRAMLRSKIVFESASSSHRGSSLGFGSDHSRHEGLRISWSQHERSMSKESFRLSYAASSTLTQTTTPRPRPIEEHRSSLFELPSSTENPQLDAPDWAQANVGLIDSNQASCNNHNKFDTASVNWESVQEPLDYCNQFFSQQSPMASAELFGMSDTNYLAQFDSIDFDFGKLIHQPDTIT
jgi:hypothetical protein